MLTKYVCFFIVTTLVAGCSNAPPKESPDVTKQKALAGTWSKEDEMAKFTWTIQPEGTFVLRIDATSGSIAECYFRDIQVSGSWKVKDGRIVSLVTQSTCTRGWLTWELELLGETLVPRIGSEWSDEIIEILEDRCIIKSGSEHDKHVRPGSGTWYRVR